MIQERRIEIEEHQTEAERKGNNNPEKFMHLLKYFLWK